MSQLIYNRSNFHNRTFCIFNEVDLDVIKDVKPNFKSKSGSSYYFTEIGVYRLSNHWGRAANCKWRLITEVKNSNKTKLALIHSQARVGFANWNAFYPDNNFDKLYFIEVDYATQSVNYFHKQTEKDSSEKVLRTAAETTKRIKQIRILFEETAWTKHLNEDNPEIIRKKIIEKLIGTNKSFHEIRREYL